MTDQRIQGNQRNQRPLFQTTLVAMMAGLAFIVMYFDFPLPFFPPYLKIDFSEIPALITAIALGPVPGIMVELLKNILHYVVKGSETGVPIGQIANFVAGSILILGTTFVYKRKPTKSGLILGLILGSVLMTIVMSVGNLYVILPFYEKFMGYTMTQAERLGSVLVGIGPFNLIKGFILTALMIPIYLSLKPRLKFF